MQTETLQHPSTKTIEQACAFIREASANSSVYIGSDSIRSKHKGGWIARYATVIIVHKDSRHGGKVFTWIEEQPDYGNLKQRLLYEAQCAIHAVDGVIDAVLEKDLHIEVHLDLNPSPNHKSNVAVKEACGWVLGATGIDPKIKPDGFASSHAADAAVKGKLKRK